MSIGGSFLAGSLPLIYVPQAQDNPTLEYLDQNSLPGGWILIDWKKSGKQYIQAFQEK